MVAHSLWTVRAVGIETRRSDRVIYDRFSQSLRPVHVRFARKQMRGWRTKTRIEVRQTSVKMSNASEERFLIDRGTDAKWASRTSWGEESYVEVASTLGNNAYSTT
jgi:hypothetical protein